jgi:hypothetical protein
MGKMDGRCMCGAISYEVSIDEPLAAGICHCTDCRRQSGAPYSIVVGVPSEAVTLTGTTKVFDTFSDEREAHAHRHFCGDCGSPIMSVLGDDDDVWWIKAGTMDDPSWIEPELEVWTDSKLPWVDSIEREERGYFPRGLPT